ncbi:MAG: EAL domain-containing protein [Pseudomonadota bacterium]
MPLVALGLAVVAAAIWGAWMSSARLAELEDSSDRVLRMTAQTRLVQVETIRLVDALRTVSTQELSEFPADRNSTELRSAAVRLDSVAGQLKRMIPPDLSSARFDALLETTTEITSLSEDFLRRGTLSAELFEGAARSAGTVPGRVEDVLRQLVGISAANFAAQALLQEQIVHAVVAAVGMVGAIGLLFVFQLVSGLRGALERLPGRFSDLADGTAEPLDRVAGPISGLTDQLDALALEFRDKLLENEKIERMAFTDSLTGLPNRRGLLAFLDLLANRDDVWEDDGKIGLIHLDLDHFKAVNDTLGHDAGDFVLREATRRMSTAIRDSDLLARLGGDEFLIVATGIECEADLTRMAERLIAQFENPIIYDERVCRVGVSMGMVLGGQRGRVRDPKRLLINADMALFRAKSQGRGRFAIFNSAMADEARRRNERAIALGNAIHSESFHPWFQPIVDCATGKAAGLELLARWHDAERGIVMPQDFIQDAEANSLMEDIGLQVLHRALTAIRKWHRSSLDVPVLHLNLSRTQLLSASFVDRLSWMLDDNNIPPAMVAVEISEADCVFRGSDVAVANLRRLAQLGVGVVLDDFGARDGALKNISRVGAGTIKFNVPAIFGSGSQSSGFEASADLIANLQRGAGSAGLLVCAKGVESVETSALLSDCGIRVQQGDHHAPVLNLADTQDWLRTRKQRASEPEPRSA